MFLKIRFGEIISIVIGIFVTAIVFFLQEEKKEPAFSVLSDDIIAESQINDRLKIFWDSTRIENVHLVKIAVWNDGKKYIDRSDFSADNPMAIIPSIYCKILNIQFLKRSRPSLNFGAFTINDSLKTKIELKILGDDGLESKDGAIFMILYSSKANVSWRVDGRIKESASGFKNFQLNKEDISHFSDGGYFYLVFMILGECLLIFVISTLIISFINGKIDMSSKSSSKFTRTLNIGTAHVFYWALVAILTYLLIRLSLYIIFYLGHFNSLKWLFS